MSEHLEPVPFGEAPTLDDAAAARPAWAPKGHDLAEASTRLQERLGELQAALYADGERALLVVLQGRDASGKDGTIRHVFSAANPQGCQVVSFAAPSEIAQRHDFLWRVHASVPRKGMIGIFNRSHYEDVLVARVRSLVPKELWERRYDHINAFERLLVDEGTIVVKFLLHVSREEQRQRLLERVNDPAKNWKFRAGDLDDRARWDEYTAAYRDAAARCSTAWAPWYVVPADRKKVRDWLIADTLVRTLERVDMRLPEADASDLATWRAALAPGVTDER